MPLAGPAWKPLAGLLVADFSAQLPGAVTSSLLSDMGAEVVKVEPPTGDYARQIPGGIFDRSNRNKRSLVLNLKTPEGQEIARRLAARSDILLESWRPGVADRLGVGSDRLTADFPRLIYCSISGYGQSGPKCCAAGHDLGYLAASGSMAIASHWCRAPARPAVPVADLAAGSFALSAILAALLERGATGRGRRIDASLYEAAVYCAGLRTYFDRNAIERSHLSPTNDVYDTADGRQVALSIIEDSFWNNFLEAAGERDAELRAERFATSQARIANGDELAARLDKLFRSETAEIWKLVFADRDVPFDICLTPGEAAAHPQAVARGVLVESGGRYYCSFPVVVDGGRPRRGTAAPALGQDSREVLEMLGYAADEIAKLTASGAVSATGT